MQQITEGRLGRAELKSLRSALLIQQPPEISSNISRKIGSEINGADWALSSSSRLAVLIQ